MVFKGLNRFKSVVCLAVRVKKAQGCLVKAHVLSPFACVALPLGWPLLSFWPGF